MATPTAKIVITMSDTIDKESLESEIIAGSLVCPDLTTWYQFYNFLDSNIPNEIPAIFGPTGIYVANNYLKNSRFREQLDAASKNNFEDEAYAFLLKTDIQLWTRSTKKLDPNEATWWVRDAENETIFWQEQMDASQEAIENLFGKDEWDWSKIDDIFDEAGVIDQLHDPKQAADLIEKTSYSTNTKDSLKILYQLYHNQMSHQYGVDSLDMFLIYVIDRNE